MLLPLGLTTLATSLIVKWLLFARVSWIKLREYCPSDFGIVPVRCLGLWICGQIVSIDLGP